MKNQAFTVAVLASLLVTLAVVTVDAGISARAESTIPFGFTAGGRTVPAGTYTILETNMAGILALRNARGESFLIPSLQAARHNDMARTQLIFHRYGNRYFLARVSFGAGQNYDLGMSRAERELVNGKSNSLANNKLKPELIDIDAH